MKNSEREVKYYDFGTVKCMMERTSSGCYKTTVHYDTVTVTDMFFTKEQALEEILSYVELTEEEWEEEMDSIIYDELLKAMY